MGCDIHVVAEVKKDGVWQLVDVEVPDDRSYWTFGILADVRNGSGFAGCDMSDKLPFISQPRDLPTDMSEELKTKLADEGNGDDCFWLGDHSFSWVTLREMLDYPYAGEMVTRGMVTNAQAEAYRMSGILPESWCGFTNQVGYERIEWKRPVKEAAWLFGQIIEKLKPLGEPENVRIVFGFDN